MGWLNQIGGLLEQYAGGQNPPRSVDDDFDQVARAAPHEELTQGIAGAFRSDQTPPFPRMVGQLFGQSDNHQRAGLLNALLGAAGPAVLSQVLGGGGGGGGPLGALSGLLGAGGQPRVTPEMAARVPPEAVEQLAAQAERQNPSIIDTVSDFAARNPQLVKTLGTAALGIAMAHFAGRRR
jgi:hypothetical protein